MKCIGAALLCFLRTGSLRRRKELCEEIAKCVEIPDTQVVTADSETVGFSGVGSAAAPLSANAKISTAPNNALQIHTGGLFVPASQGGGMSAVEVVNEDTVTLSGQGTATSPLQASTNIVAGGDNRLSVMTNPAGTRELYSAPEAFATSSSVIWQGSGSADDPKKANVRLSANPGNGLEMTLTGLFVKASSGDGTGVEFAQQLEFLESGFAPTTQIVGPVGARFQIKRALNDPSAGPNNDVSEVYTIPNSGVRSCGFLLQNYGKFFIVHEGSTTAAGVACAATTP